MYQLLICDDNQAQVDYVEQQILLLPNHGQFHIQKTTNPANLIQNLKENGCHFDIIFLDINMGNFNGIQVARIINQLNAETQIIYITNYIQYATSVYETDHTIFLTKEQFSVWLPKALSLAIRNLEQLRSYTIPISFGSTHIILKQYNILYMERSLRTTIIVTQQGTYQTAAKLSVLQPLLKTFFISCHRSFIVNLHHVKVYNTSNFIMDNGTTITISRNYQASVKNAFFNFLHAVDPADSKNKLSNAD